QFLDIAYHATLKTEEGRFIKGSLTVVDPTNPHPDLPITRRADYPEYTQFGHKISLSVDSVVKLSRAIDNWSSSIAVYGTTKSNVYAWGVADQLVQQNIMINREANEGFSNPGLLTISMEGPGELVIYHGNLFLARLKQ